MNNDVVNPSTVAMQIIGLICILTSFINWFVLMINDIFPIIGTLGCPSQRSTSGNYLFEEGTYHIYIPYCNICICSCREQSLLMLFVLYYIYIIIYIILFLSMIWYNTSTDSIVQAICDLLRVPTSNQRSSLSIQKTAFPIQHLFEGIYSNNA